MSLPVQTKPQVLPSSQIKKIRDIAQFHIWHLVSKEKENRAAKTSKPGALFLWLPLAGRKSIQKTFYKANSG